MDSLKKRFRNPPREYGIYPIIHGGIANAEAYAQQMDENGMAGVVGNVPYGSGYPDDAKEWARTAEGFTAFARRGMKTWIYDEKGYPSGTAGGAVLERHPEYESLCLVCYEYWRTVTGPSQYRADTIDGRLFRALLVPVGGGEPVDISHFADSSGTLRIEVPAGAWRIVVLSVRRLFDATHSAHSYSEPRRYINPLQREATEQFVALTHELYLRHLGDTFAGSVRAFFTDEPSLMSWNIHEVPYPLLSWREDFPEVFRARYGYEIERAVLAVLKQSGPESIPRRCDFWEFTATELADNFFGCIQDWCRAHGSAASGHLIEEEQLLDHIFTYGSYYKCMKRFDIPGIDQLESEPTKLMNDCVIPAGRLAASIADIYGLPEIFSEASDHTSRIEGRQIPMEWIRASMNWHFAQGINNITSYYTFTHFKPEELRELNRYVARLGVLLRWGERYSRVAVLYPEYALWTAVEATGSERCRKQPRQAEEIREIFTKVSWDLLHRQADYDYIDEEVIREAEPGRGCLSFRSRRYECVVLPAARVMDARSVEKLLLFMRSGGRVICVGSLPDTDRATGKTGLFAADYAKYIAAGRLIHVAAEPGWELPDCLPRTLRLVPGDRRSMLSGAAGTLSAAAGEVLSPQILSHVRRQSGRMLVFLCNMSGMPYRATMLLEKGKSCLVACPDDGTLLPAECEADAQRFSVQVELGPYAALGYFVR